MMEMRLITCLSLNFNIMVLHRVIRCSLFTSALTARQPKTTPEERDELNSVDVLPLVASVASTFEGGVGLSDFVSLETMPLFECLLESLVRRIPCVSLIHAFRATGACSSVRL
jgi:hypothetical protein